VKTSLNEVLKLLIYQDGIQLPNQTAEPAMMIVELPLGAEVTCSSTDSRVSISEPPDIDESSQVKRREKVGIQTSIK